MDQIDRDIIEHQLKASSWDNLTIIQGNLFESVFFYLLDTRTAHARLVTIKRDDFYRRDPFADSQPIELFSTIIEQKMKAVHASSGKNDADLDLLAQACKGYFKLTQTYRQWLMKAGEKDTLHAAILIYPGEMIRPFALTPDDRIVSSEYFLAAAAQVEQTDRKNHPEWFPKKTKR